MKKFTKYHGCGNDFIIVNRRDTEDLNYAEAAVNWCRRSTGVGADGLIVACKSPDAEEPLEMIIYNSDGSCAPMCGNGIRCFVKYCYDEGIETSLRYPVKTGAGILEAVVKSTEPFMVEVHMGKPDFEPETSSIDVHTTDVNADSEKLPESESTGPGEPARRDFINQKLSIDEWTVPVSTFFLGTVHTVVWEENIPAFDKIAFAEKLSNHPIYKEKTNVNIVKVLNRSTIELTTFERGAGLTAACGTGACASAVLGIKEGRLDSKVKVKLPFGELIITQKEDGNVFMEGPAAKIADGNICEQN